MPCMIPRRPVGRNEHPVTSGYFACPRLNKRRISTTWPQLRRIARRSADVRPSFAKIVVLPTLGASGDLAEPGVGQSQRSCVLGDVLEEALTPREVLD